MEPDQFADFGMTATGPKQTLERILEWPEISLPRAGAPYRKQNNDKRADPFSHPHLCCGSAAGRPAPMSAGHSHRHPGATDYGRPSAVTQLLVAGMGGKPT